MLRCFITWKSIFGGLLLTSLGLTRAISLHLHLLNSRLEVAQFSLGWPHFMMFSANFWRCGLRWVASILAGAGIGVLLIPAFFLTLALVGFTAGGVVGGSLAACCQRKLGAVAAGSCFSATQSIAAKGMIASCSLRAVLTTSLIGAAVAFYLMYMLHCDWFGDVCCDVDWRWWTNTTQN